MRFQPVLITDPQSSRHLGKCGHTATVYGNTLVIIGGKNRDGPTREAVFFDTDSLRTAIPKVTATKATPKSLYGHTTTRIGSRFYIMGGWIEAGKLELSLNQKKLLVMAVIDDGTLISRLRSRANRHCTLVFDSLQWRCACSSSKSHSCALQHEGRHVRRIHWPILERRVRARHWKLALDQTDAHRRSTGTTRWPHCNSGWKSNAGDGRP